VSRKPWWRLRRGRDVPAEATWTLIYADDRWNLVLRSAPGYGGEETFADRTIPEGDPEAAMDWARTMVPATHLNTILIW